MNLCFSRNGPRMETCISFLIEPDGGIFTLNPQARSPRYSRLKLKSVCRNGCLGIRATPFYPITVSPVFTTTMGWNTSPSLIYIRKRPRYCRALTQPSAALLPMKLTLFSFQRPLRQKRPRLPQSIYEEEEFELSNEV